MNVGLTIKLSYTHIICTPSLSFLSPHRRYYELDIISCPKVINAAKAAQVVGGKVETVKEKGLFLLWKVELSILQ